MTQLTDRIARAKELLVTVRHGALATVNADGTPLNSPVFVAVGPGCTLFWASSPEAQHSQNIVRTGQVFAVLFDSIDQGGGLYLEAEAGEVAGGELAAGLKVFNAARRRLLREDVATNSFISGSQRLYCARPQKLWVNISTKDAQGRIIKDARHEIELADIA